MLLTFAIFGSILTAHVFIDDVFGKRRWPTFVRVAMAGLCSILWGLFYFFS